VGHFLQTNPRMEIDSSVVFFLGPIGEINLMKDHTKVEEKNFCKRSLEGDEDLRALS
jgi:hypothetical protein